MRGLKELTWISFKLYLREPIAAFFTLAFPTMLVLLFGAIYGNEPAELFGGRGSMDVSLPAYSGLIVGTIGLMSVPITTAGYREQGILRRFRVTPLKPWTYILADQSTNLLMTVTRHAACKRRGVARFSISNLPARSRRLLLAIVLSTLAMSALGYLIASVANGARMAQVMSMIIFYPMMFLSGAGMPIEILPESIRHISNFLPLTYVVRLMRGLWFGDPLTAHWLEIGILAGITLVAGLRLQGDFSAGNKPLASVGLPQSSEHAGNCTSLLYRPGESWSCSVHATSGVSAGCSRADDFCTSSRLAGRLPSKHEKVRTEDVITLELERSYRYGQPVPGQGDGHCQQVADHHPGGRFLDDGHFGLDRRRCLPLRWLPTPITCTPCWHVLGLVLAHAANNMINDYFDLEGGVDDDAYTRALYAPHPVLSGLLTHAPAANCDPGRQPG